MSIKTKHIVQAAILLFSLFSCSSKPLIYSLISDKDELNFSNSVSGEYIVITSNDNWSISGVLPQWLTVVPSSGEEGNTKIRVECSENNDLESRSSTIMIKSGDFSLEIPVIQQPKLLFTASGKSFDIDEFGGEIEFNVSSNVITAPEITEGNGWLRIVSSKAINNSSITISVSPLQEDILRTGTIKFRDNYNKFIDSVKINQATHKYTNRKILEKLYASTGGDFWANKTNWLSDKPFNEWYGIETEGSDITGIFLQANNLSGTIPKELSGLKNLKVLHLWGNNMGGTIPAELGGLRSLETLYLSNNDFSGSYPDSLFTVTGLKNLSLSYNTKLSLNLVKALESYKSIETLALDYLNISNTIPDIIGDRRSLKVLSVICCGFTGHIPDNFFNLTNLEYICLNGNSLSGPLSANIENLTKLTTLNLAGNDLSGNIPLQLYALKKLSSLDLSYNSFTGPVPYSLTRLPSWSLFTPAISVFPQKNGVTLSADGYIAGDIYFDQEGNEVGVVYLLTGPTGIPLGDQSGNSLHGYVISSNINTTIWSRLYSDTPADDYNDGNENVLSLLRYIERNSLIQDDFPAFKWCKNQNTGEEIIWYLPSPAETARLVPLNDLINQTLKLIDKNITLDNGPILTSYDGNNSDSFIGIALTAPHNLQTIDKKTPCKTVLIRKF